MGLTGDTLTVFCLLAGGALSTLLASLSVSGRTRYSLWLLTGLLALGSAAIFFTAGQVDWGAVVPFGYAAVPPVTIGLVVLLLRSHVRGTAPAGQVEVAPPRPRTPQEKVAAANASLWSPDIAIDAVADHIRRSGWRPRYGPVSSHALAEEIHRALYTGSITAWGRIHPDAEEFQIATGPWNFSDLETLNGYAFLRQAKVAIFGLRFSQGEVEAVWPT